MSDAAQIRSRASDLVGKKITLVLRDNTVQTGEVESLVNEGLVMRNMRLKKSEYPFKHIAEIYFDTVV